MKKFISLIVAGIMMLSMMNFAVLAQGDTTITVTEKVVANGSVTLKGVTNKPNADLEVFISDADGHRVESDTVKADDNGSFEYTFEAVESGRYNYVVSEVTESTNVFTEDFTDGVTTKATGCWVANNLLVDSTIVQNATLKLGKGSRYLYALHREGNNFTDPKQNAKYTVEADFRIDATEKPASVEIIKTSAPGGSHVTGSGDINTSGKSHAYIIKAAGQDVVIVKADNNVSQTAETNATLISNYELGKKYSVKIEFDIDTFAMRTFVDGTEVLTDKNDMFIFSQEFAGYGRLIETQIQSDDATLYMANVKATRSEKVCAKGTVKYSTPAEIQAVVDELKSKADSTEFKMALAENAETLVIDTSKAFYADGTVMGSVYTDAKTNMTDVNSLRTILVKAETLYNLKSAVAENPKDWTKIESLVSAYHYDIKYSEISENGKTALDTATYTFDINKTVDENINGWVSAMKTAYGNVVIVDGKTYVNYSATQRVGAINVSGTVNPAAAIKLKATATCGQDVFSKVFTTDADGSFDESFDVAETLEEKVYNVKIEAVNDDSAITSIYSSAFDAVPTKTGNVLNVTNLNVENGALKFGNGQSSTFIVGVNSLPQMGRVVVEAKVKKIDTDKSEIKTIIGPTNGISGSRAFALGAKGTKFMLYYTDSEKTSGHLHNSMELAEINTNKWYDFKYETDRVTHETTIYFEGEKVLTLAAASHQQDLPYVLDSRASASQGIHYIDDLNAYIDNGVIICAGEQTVTVAPNAKDITILSLDEKEVKVISPETKTVTVILASYNGRRFVDAKITGIELFAGVNTISTSGLSITGTTKISAFVWNNLVDIQPLCQPMSIPVE